MAVLVLDTIELGPIPMAVLAAKQADMLGLTCALS